VLVEPVILKGFAGQAGETVKTERQLDHGSPIAPPFAGIRNAKSGALW
jgi:hypothetical protein